MSFIFVLLFYCFFSFLALTLASFFNLVIYRTAKEESFITGRSYCETCHQKIAWYDNIPLLSFLILKGKSRCCQQKIGQNHFWAELTALIYALVFSFVVLQNQLLLSLESWQLAFYFLFYLTLSFVFIADIQYLIVPDFLTLFLLVLVIFMQVMTINSANAEIEMITNLFYGVSFALFFFVILYIVAKLWLKKEALGIGDIKLILPLALFLSWPMIALAIFLSFIIGGFFAMLMLLIGKKKFGQALPFAPFLVVATVICSFWGQEIWQWYFAYLL